MSGHVLVELAAKRDILDAATWYERERDGLGGEFLGDARRALPHRFPYAVYFTIHPKSIRVKAVLHQHRGPNALATRLGRDG